MAPRKRKAEEEVSKDLKEKTATLGNRVTRSMTRREGDSSNSVKPKKKEAPKKKKKKEEKKEKEEEVTKEEEEEEKGPTKKRRTIIVEHCKQCNSFKTRATIVKDGLEKAVPGGVSVILNPDKPRRGCFEIREEGGEKFISLLDMKRPFQPMKALDMEQVISDIVDKIQG